MVILLCILIAVGGITEQNMRLKPSGYMRVIEGTALGGGILIAIFLYLLYVSTLLLRMRLDDRGILFTRAKGLLGKIAWKDVKSVKCYEREGGMTMNKTIRYLEIKSKDAKSSAFSFMNNPNIIKMRSDIWGQESLDKTVRVIRFYNKKFDFEASIDEWKTDEQFMFASSDKE